jgi:hypothetical protein
MTKLTQGRKRRTTAEFSRRLSYCFDRFDLNCGLLDLHETGSKEHRMTQRRAQRWAKRAMHYDVLRNAVSNV